ncbi:uncharacterized protein LOC113857393 [Abrus precatorius]|uniref:Uncharacterized protein LOC113857393 n=1 Tax=Abrus precatorius TaxID=3816 RepID=A0A8B8KNX8_ABRPR|nr:uncharacterized protein LOC113857393 [Abrus precatorius]
MDPVEVLPPWVPEDDLLLKNAVEAGASLESLAKGAVRFSRRYSVTELRDRWRSLLYDADVSVTASASMAILELAKLSGSGSGSKEGSGEGRKRKVQSIRKQYYAMRKRHGRCREGVNVEKNAVVCDGNGSVVVDGNLNDDVNNLVNYGDYSGLEGVGVGQSNSISDVPLWKTIEDVSVPDMPVQVNVLESENRCSEGREIVSHGLSLEGKCENGGVNAPDAVLGDDAVRISDSLLDLTGDELIYVDIDGKDATAADKPCYDNVDSLLLSSPCDVQGNHVAGVCEPQKLDAETKFAVRSGSSSTVLEGVASSLGSSRGDQHFVSDSGNDVGSSVAAQSSHPELREDNMFCVLNTEDPVVPCNDHITLSILVPHSVALKSRPIVKEVGYSESVMNNQRRNELVGSLNKEDVLSHSFAASQTVRQGLLSNINSSYPPVDLVPKSENPGRNSISAVSRQSNNVNVNINPSHSRLVSATVMPASDRHLKQEEIVALTSAEVYAHTKVEEHKVLPKSEAKSFSLDQEEGDVDDDDDDDEIPDFSDAEAMILEMDLCPTDQDTNASREVLRYQHEETKRTIMRLEQGAQSFMGRAIKSQGAFAVLYGRILKKYIKKSEVILGRATDDVHVDIDLRKEGQDANKISRRQALIRMQANGSFVIKNLGKRSIFLNGKEVATGQVRGLNASSLIEIRGISLIFEINNRCVRRFLENVNENR